MNNEVLKSVFNENTTIFFEHGNDPNVYNFEIANHLDRTKIAEINLKKITPIRYRVLGIQLF